MLIQIYGTTRPKWIKLKFIGGISYQKQSFYFRKIHGDIFSWFSRSFLCNVRRSKALYQASMVQYFIN